MAHELPSSELGTKIYWDDVYSKELENFKEDPEDVGEVWFGEDSVERVVTWLEESELVIKDSSILDLGCGNGASLTELNNIGYRDLTGVDYSQNAIDLAIGVAKEQDADIKYETCDILLDLSTCKEGVLCRQYDVILDKGTYDAISLNPDNSVTQRAKYIKNIHSLMKNGGLFFITSCNWTEEELKQHFENEFAFHAKLKVPTFQFGGVTGNRETQVIFRKPS